MSYLGFIHYYNGVGSGAVNEVAGFAVLVDQQGVVASVEDSGIIVEFDDQVITAKLDDETGAGIER